WIRSPMCATIARCAVSVRSLPTRIESTQVRCSRRRTPSPRGCDRSSQSGRQRYGREDTVGVEPLLRRKEAARVRAVRVRDLFVVVRREQVGVATRQRVCGKGDRELLGPGAMTGAVAILGRPAGDDLDDEVVTAVAEGRARNRYTRRRPVKVVNRHPRTGR